MMFKEKSSIQRGNKKKFVYKFHILFKLLVELIRKKPIKNIRDFSNI